MATPLNLDKDPIKSLFFKYYTPTLTSLLSISIHQIINGIILGQYVGKEGIAAVGLYGPVLIIFIAFALALMIGGGILIAKSIGAKVYQDAQDVFQFTTTLALILGGIIAISSPFITGPITFFLTGNESAEIMNSTFDYMFWGFIWLPFFFLRMLWGNFVNNDSGPKVSRNVSLFAVLMNIVLDFIFIAAFHLGTAGASIATGISIFASVIYLFVYISREKGHLSFKKFRFTLKLKAWKELFNYGIPSIASEISFSLGLLLINKSLVSYGTIAVAAFGLVNHISFIFIRLLTAAMISALPIMSFNIGAALPKRVLETLKISMLFTFLLGAIISASGFLFSDFLVNIFSGDESEEFRKTGTNALGLYFILFLAAGPNYILGAYLQSIGKSTLSITINLLKGCVFVGFFLLLLPRYLKMEMNGVWLSRSFTEISTLILVGLFTLYYRKDYYSNETILFKNRK